MIIKNVLVYGIKKKYFKYLVINVLKTRYYKMMDIFMDFFMLRSNYHLTVYIQSYIYTVLHDKILKNNLGSLKMLKTVKC